MGINIPSKEELIASKCSIEETRIHLEADSLAYLSVDGLQMVRLLYIYFKYIPMNILQAVDDAKTNIEDNQSIEINHNCPPTTKLTEKRHCTACFTGDYPGKRLFDW
jgi:hypothetical protein